MLHRSGAAKPMTSGRALLRVLWGAALVILLQAFCSSSLHAQIYSGTIDGTVTDASGAALAGATVTVVNTGTGEVHTATTSDQGYYTVPQLAAGTYQVTIDQPKFKEYVANNVVVHVSTDTRADAKLSVGGVSQKVVVTANPLQVQTTSASVGLIVGSKQVKELPLNGENFMNLVTLSPGVSTAGSFDGIDKGLQGGADFSVNGNPYNNNLFLVDGVNNNDVGSGRTILVYPSIYTIAEFKIITNSYGPEYGQADGAIISITTKSGTNQIHGGFFYAGRNDAVSAEDWFSKNAKTGKAELRRNDFGYNVSGPIMKNKLFLWWNQEWNKQIQGVANEGCMPTTAETHGDYSAYATPTISSTTGTLSGPGAVGVKDQCQQEVPAFNQQQNGQTTNAVNEESGQKITNPDPGGVAMMGYYPAPNVTNGLIANQFNWVAQEREKPDWSEWHVRADYDITPKNHATFSWTNDSWTAPGPNPGIFWGDNSFGPVSSDWSQPSRSIMGRLTSNITNSLVNDLEFGYGHNAIITTLSSQSKPLVAAINAAIPTSWPSSLKQTGATPVVWGGYGNYGQSAIGGGTLWNIAPYANHEDLYALQDNITKVQGNHLFKAGAYYSWNTKVEDGNGGTDQPSFGGLANNPNTGAPLMETSDPMADAQLPGQYYNSNENNINQTAYVGWHDFEWYLGDTYKASSRVTVNYGFRWSFLREPYATNNQWANWRLEDYSASENIWATTPDPATDTVGVPGSQYGDACNGTLVVPGTNPCQATNQELVSLGIEPTGTNYLSSGTQGPNSALAFQSMHDIAPRLGVNWDVFGNGKTSLRAGVGQFYQREPVGWFENLSKTAPFEVNASNVRTLDASAPLTNPALSPQGARSMRNVTPNSWQWNLTAEQQLGRNQTLQVGYVGDAGVHLTSWRDENPVSPVNFVNEAFMSNPTDQKYLRQAQNFGTVQDVMRTGHSTYHSLQALYRLQTGQSSTFQVAYTWSHSIADVQLNNSSGSISNEAVTDQADPGLDKGSTEINRPNILVANEVYYLPKLEGHSGLLQGVLGGWEFNSILQANSGSNTTVYASGPSDANGNSASGTCVDALNNKQECQLSSLLGTGYTNVERPLVVPGASCSVVTNPYTRNRIFNANAFTFVGFQIGNPLQPGMERRGSCSNPKAFNINAQLAKNWSIKGRYNIKFSMDAFNLFNRLNLSSTSGPSLSAAGLDCGGAPCTPKNNVVTGQVGVTENLSAGNPNAGFGYAGAGNLIAGQQSRLFQYTLRFEF
jgi:hypothetical protein